jgi:hypothetical protein
VDSAARVVRIGSTCRFVQMSYQYMLSSRLRIPMCLRFIRIYVTRNDVQAADQSEDDILLQPCVFRATVGSLKNIWHLVTSPCVGCV